MNSNEILAEQQQLEVSQDDMNYENDDNYDENQASEGHQNGDDDNNLESHLLRHHHQQQQLQQVYHDYEESKAAEEEHIPNNLDEQAFEEPEGMAEDFVVNQDDNDVIDDNIEGSEDPENLAQVKNEANDPNLWTLPPDKETCTLEEIRRGQVVNKVASNECPVVGCGKKINEASLEPSPGTIASGLRTHVLFVHYANRKGVKKRKLGWSNKRRSSASPKKQFGMPHPNMHSSTPIWGEPELEGEPENFSYSSNDMLPPLSSGTSLIQRNYNNQNRNSPPGSLLNKKIKQLSAGHGPQQSSLQSLMQATGMGFPSTTSSNSNNNNSNNTNGNNNVTRFSPQNKQKGQDLSSSQKNFNQTTSSLFSILAGLTQQPQQQQQQQQSQPQQQQQPQPQQQQHTQQRNHPGSHSQQPRNVKAAHSGNTISVSQCSKNNNGNYVSNPPINSSLLSLLSEKISGNVASALHSQLRKSSTPSARANQYNNQQNVSSNDNNHFNNGSSINDVPMSTLNHFIESVARKTGSNIGPAGVAEAKKIIEKFTSWLICSSQTIADHYIAPFAGEAPQQKPEISASDVILAYKMMQKSHPQ